MSSRSRMVNASAVSSAPSLDVASANLRVPCGPSSVRRQAAIDPSASALPAGLAGSIDALIEPSGLHASTIVPRSALWWRSSLLGRKHGALRAAKSS